jgi:hypothetical protein
MTPIIVLLGATLGLYGDQARADESVNVPGRVDVLQYDDGTAVWFTWGGLYRGVWFNAADFGAMPGVSIGQLEYWFYHSTIYSWDTSSFLAEIWGGQSWGPNDELAQTSVMALHNTATFVTYASPIWCGSSCWVLENTTLSDGGWPSLWGDGTAHSVSHSFTSDDFEVWEPWIVGAPYQTASDFLIRAYGGGTALGRQTWGSIKTLF